MVKRPVPSFLIFRDKKDHWRWNFAARNGRIIAASSVGYARQQGCVQAIKLMKGQGQADVPILVRRAPPAAATPATEADQAPDAAAQIEPQAETNDNQPDATLDLESEQILH